MPLFFYLTFFKFYIIIFIEERRLVCVYLGENVATIGQFYIEENYKFCGDVKNVEWSVGLKYE